MAVSLTGTQPVVTDSAVIPAHAPGDLIVAVFARVSTPAPPSPPTVGGTVPAWTYVTNTYQRIAWAVATRSDHTTGSFAFASSGGIFVFRSTTGWTLTAVGFALQSGSTGFVNFAALTPQKTDSTSMGLRVATKVAAGIANNGSQIGFVNQVFVASPTNAVFGSYTKAALTAADIASGSISGWGAASSSVTATIEIREVTPPLPVNTGAPVVTGIAQVGQTLACSTGSWTGTPSSYAYQWKRAGANIAGATGSTYVSQTIDAKQAITCTVTATGPGGSASATSNSVTPLILYPPIWTVV